MLCVTLLTASGTSSVLVVLLAVMLTRAIANAVSGSRAWLIGRAAERTRASETWRVTISTQPSVCGTCAMTE